MWPLADMYLVFDPIKVYWKDKVGRCRCLDTAVHKSLIQIQNQGYWFMVAPRHATWRESRLDGSATQRFRVGRQLFDEQVRIELVPVVVLLIFFLSSSSSLGGSGSFSFTATLLCDPLRFLCDAGLFCETFPLIRIFVVRSFRNLIASVTKYAKHRGEQ